MTAATQAALENLVRAIIIMLLCYYDIIGCLDPSCRKADSAAQLSAPVIFTLCDFIIDLGQHVEIVLP